jgi:hypothetical protein
LIFSSLFFTVIGSTQIGLKSTKIGSTDTILSFDRSQSTDAVNGQDAVNRQESVNRQGC